MCCKCGAARIIQAGAASVDLCPKYAHASGGQECGAPKLIVRISGGLCIVYTAQGSGNSSLVRSDWRVFLRALGAEQRKGGPGGRAGLQTSPQTQLTACQTDKQWQTADTFLRTEAHVWTEAAAGGSTSSRLRPRAAGNVFYTNVSCNRPNSTSGFEMILFPSLTKALLLCYILGNICLSGDLHQTAEKTITDCDNRTFWIISDYGKTDVDTILYRASGFYLISTADGLKSLGHLTLGYFGRYKTGLILTWVEMCHTLISSYNSCSSVFIRRSFQTINTAFSCSWSEVSEPQGLCGLSPSNSLFFPLF